jgi:DNA polymerase
LWDESEWADYIGNDLSGHKYNFRIMFSPPSGSTTPPPKGDPARALQLLISHLQSKLANGQQKIWLSREARRCLLEARAARQGTPQSPASSPPASRTAAAVATGNRPSAASSAPKPAAPPPPRPAVKPLSAAEKPQLLAEVKARAEAAEAPRRLGTLRSTMVFAVGNADADIMFVGEAPGIDEERQQEPFVGKAGQMLTKIIQAMGLQREQVYISNVCKFRPATSDVQGSENRKPTPEEMASCLPFVQEEIAIVQPRCIVALGATAAEGLLGAAGVTVGRMRSQFHDCGGTPLMVTYHPSYLLRTESNVEKRKVWEDMLMVMEKLGMPISEKQQRFFLPKG